MICDRDVGVDSQYCSICWHLYKPSEVYLIEGNKILCPPEGDAWFFWTSFELNTIDLLVIVKIMLEIEFFTWFTISLHSAILYNTEILVDISRAFLKNENKIKPLKIIVGNVLAAGFILWEQGACLSWQCFFFFKC